MAVVGEVLEPVVALGWVVLLQAVAACAGAQDGRCGGKRGVLGADGGSWGCGSREDGDWPECDMGRFDGGGFLVGSGEKRVLGALGWKSTRQDSIRRVLMPWAEC